MTLTSDFRSFIRLPKKTALRLAILAVLPLLILFGVNRWSAKGAWGITSTKPAPQVTFNTALQMAYFAQDNEWDSTVVLNNNAKDERFILVTLYGKNGRQANIPVFSILANSIRRFKLSDWSLGVNDFREGNINVDYYRTDFIHQTVIDLEDARELQFYNLTGKSFANAVQVEANYEVIKRFDVKLAYKYEQAKTDYKSGRKIIPLRPQHRLLKYQECEFYRTN